MRVQNKNLPSHGIEPMTLADAPGQKNHTLPAEPLDH